MKNDKELHIEPDGCEYDGSLVFDKDSAALRAISVFLLSLQGFAYLVEIYNSEEKRANIWADDDFAVFAGAVCGLRLRWTPNKVMSRMAKNSWPDRIHFMTASHPVCTIAPQAKFGIAWDLLFSQTQFMLTSVYEEYKHAIRREYGTKDNDWPSCWKFARMLRETLSHGGRIFIKNDGIYTWRNLSITNKNNGENLLHNYILEADIIVLLHEMADFVGAKQFQRHSVSHTSDSTITFLA